MRPSECFDYAETALAVLCAGCPDERGWLNPDCGRGDMCPGMAAISDDAEGSVVTGPDGLPRCPARRDREDKQKSAAVAKYERRMRGDWT